MEQQLSTGKLKAFSRASKMRVSLEEVRNRVMVALEMLRVSGMSVDIQVLQRVRDIRFEVADARDSIISALKEEGDATRSAVSAAVADALRAALPELVRGHLQETLAPFLEGIQQAMLRGDVSAGQRHDELVAQLSRAVSSGASGSAAAPLDVDALASRLRGPLREAVREAGQERHEAVMASLGSVGAESRQEHTEVIGVLEQLRDAIDRQSQGQAPAPVDGMTPDEVASVTRTVTREELCEHIRARDESMRNGQAGQVPNPAPTEPSDEELLASLDPELRAVLTPEDVRGHLEARRVEAKRRAVENAPKTLFMGVWVDVDLYRTADPVALAELVREHRAYRAKHPRAAPAGGGRGAAPPAAATREPSDEELLASIDPELRAVLTPEDVRGHLEARRVEARRKAAGAGGPHAVPVPSAPPPPDPAAGVSEAEASAAAVLGHCVVCLCKMRDVLFDPCGHLCLCSECSGVMVARDDWRCPVCRRSGQPRRVFIP